MALAVLLFLLLESQVSSAKTPLEWRQEFNGIVASIDTLMRMEGDGDWSDLDRHRPGTRGLRSYSFGRMMKRRCCQTGIALPRRD